MIECGFVLDILKPVIICDKKIN